MTDPTNSEQVEAVDHREAAEGRLTRAADIVRVDGPGRDPHLAVFEANAHATLALVDEVAKLRETVIATANSPGVLSKEEARLIAGWLPCGFDEAGEQALKRRLSVWAEEEASND